MDTLVFDFLLFFGLSFLVLLTIAHIGQVSFVRDLPPGAQVLVLSMVGTVILNILLQLISHRRNKAIMVVV